MSGSTFISWEAAVQWLREQPAQAALVQAAYYDDPLLAASQRYARSEEWDEIRRWLSGRGGQVLDVGAGRGIASYALAREGFDVTALEPDSSDLVGAGAIRSLAREAGLPIRVVEEFSERLPFADNSFDVVFARAVLHHTSDLAAAAREFFRVLKPGGMLLALREHVISQKTDLSAFLEAHPLHRLYGGEHAYSLQEYTTALRSAGFKFRRPIGPLDSPVNYFPQTRMSLRSAIAERAGKIPGAGALMRTLLASDAALSLVLRLSSLVDRRPGRLYSFLCDKPGSNRLGEPR